MAFGGEVHDRIRLVGGEHFAHCCLIGDVGAHRDVAVVAARLSSASSDAA